MDYHPPVIWFLHLWREVFVCSLIAHLTCPFSTRGLTRALSGDDRTWQGTFVVLFRFFRYTYRIDLLRFLFKSYTILLPHPPPLSLYHTYTSTLRTWSCHFLCSLLSHPLFFVVSEASSEGFFTACFHLFSLVSVWHDCFILGNDSFVVDFSPHFTSSPPVAASVPHPLGVCIRAIFQRLFRSVSQKN